MVDQTGAMSDDELLAKYAAPSSDDFVSRIAGKENPQQDPNAVSKKGAVGLMQTMPATLRDPGFGVKPARNNSPEELKRVGVDYAHALKNYYGNETLAAAAYNAGPGRVDQWLGQHGDPRAGDISFNDFVDRIPVAETKDYVKTVAPPPPPAGMSDAELAQKHGLSDDALMKKYGAQTKSASPTLDTGYLGALGTGLTEMFRAPGNVLRMYEQEAPDVAKYTALLTSLFAPSLHQAGVTATNIAKSPQPDIAAAQSFDFKGGFDPNSLAKKTIYQIVSGAPTMVAGIYGGPGGAAAMAGLGSYANNYEENLQKNGGDKSKAMTEAAVDAGIDAASMGIGWKVFDFAPFKGAVKNLLAQGLAIQPAVAMVTQAAHNVAHGKPLGEGVEDQYVQGLLPNFISLFGAHAIERALQRGSAGGSEDAAQAQTIANAMPGQGDTEVTVNGATATREPDDGGPPGPSGSSAAVTDRDYQDPRFNPDGTRILVGGVSVQSPGGTRIAGRRGPMTGTETLIPGSSEVAPQTPQPGEPIGLKFPKGPSRRATVQGYFDKGDAVRVRFEDGSVRDYLTTDLMRDRTEAPPPAQEDVEPANARQQLSPEELEAPPLDETYRGPKRPVTNPSLNAAALKGLDMAHAMEREAMDPGTKLPYETRRDMLVQAARLRSQFGIGPDGEARTPLTPGYQHPLAQEPAAPIGELAIPRVENPALYEGERAVPPPTPAAKEAAAPQPELPVAPEPERTSEGEDADLKAAIADVREGRATKAPAPDFLSTIIKTGGIKVTGPDGKPTPEGQTVKQILKDNYRPGLINNKTGITPDYLREALTERGWFGDRDPGQTTLEPFYAMLDRSARGEKIYHPEDTDAQSVADRRSLIQEEMGRAGVGASDSHAQAAQKLLNFRRSEIESMIAEHEAQSRAEVENLSPEAHNELVGYGYEPGSDHGEEHETGPSGEEPARAPEAHGEPEPEPEGQGRGEEGAPSPAGGGEPAAPLPTESVDLGKGKSGEQTVIPGAERSARQLAEAREAKGHGRVAPKAEQRDADHGLFAESDKQKTLFQRQPVFYSALTRAVERAKQERASPEQWLATVKNSPGVKKEELDWLGLEDWLKGQKGSVLKSDVANFLRENEVQVHEVTKGGVSRDETVPDEIATKDHGAEWDILAKQFRDLNENIAHARTRPDLRHAIAPLDEERTKIQQQMDRLHDQMVDETYERNVESGATSGRDAKFAQYTLPGGSNYRELLLTLPTGSSDAEAMSRAGMTPEKWKSLSEPDRQYLRRKGVPEFKSGHFDEPNVLAHIRFDDRTGPNGEKVLHIAEVQSDLHQQGRRQGYRDQASVDRADKARESANAAAAALDAARKELGNYKNDPSKSRIDNANARGALDRKLREAQGTWDAANVELLDAENKRVGGVPDFPFKSSWHELAMKRALRYAAESGSRAWHEVTKPDRIGEKAQHVLGGKLASVTPLKVMDAPMLDGLQNNQIREAVVKAIPVDVVDVLAAHGFSPDQLAREPKMVGDALPLPARTTVARGLASALEFVGARERAALRRVLLSPEPGRSDGEALAAIRAVNLDPSIVGRLLAPNRFYGLDGNMPLPGTSGADAATKLAIPRLDDARKRSEPTTAELADALNRHDAIVNDRTGEAITKYVPGYEKMTFDTGETQADRYDLSKQVDSVRYYPEKRKLVAEDKDGNVVLRKESLSPEGLPDIVGKDVADRLLKQPINGTYQELTGANLRVGGEGQKAFYDKILPQFLSKYVKKWGAKVESGVLGEHPSVKQLADGRWTVHTSTGDNGSFAKSDGAQRHLDNLIGAGKIELPTPVHSVPITDAMRESVMGGQPLFERAREGQRPQIVRPTEHTKLEDGLIGRTIGNDVSPEETHVLNAVEHEAQRLVPSAVVLPMREIAYRPEGENSMGVEPGRNVHGAIYSNGARRIIAWSLESPDAVGTLRHEAVHYLRGRGLIREPEWRTLRDKATKNDWIAKHDIAERYPDLDHEGQVEEAVADEFSKWRRDPETTKEPLAIRRAFERVSQFLHGVGSRIREMLGGDVTAEDVFHRIESGEVGRRPMANDREEPAVDTQLAKPPLRRDEEPETPEQGREYFDNIADTMAADNRGKGAGTYARTLNEKMADAWKPGRYHVLGDFQRRLIFPRTLAALDHRSGRYYNTVMVRDRAAHSMQSDYRSFANGDGHFTSLPKDSQDKVLSAMELLRLNDMDVENDGRSLVLANHDDDLARLSKPSDVIKLSPTETGALFSLKDMFAKQWSDLVAGTAKKMGWDGPPDPDAIREAAKAEGLRKSEQRNLNHTADILQAMIEQERRGYMPLMRFGDYYLAVTPKRQPGGDELGGHPPVSWYERVDSRSAIEKTLGRPSFLGEKGTPKSAERAVSDLNKMGNFGQFAKGADGKWESDTHTISHGYVPRNVDALRSLDIPAIEKLMQALEHRSGSGDASFQKNEAYQKLMDEIRDQLYAELKAGFKKRSHTVPGYSEDFRRAIGSYNFWISRHVADMLHHDDIDRARDAIVQDPNVDPNVRQFWQDWDKYQEERPGVLEKGADALANFGFYMTLAGSPATMFLIATHGPVVGLSTLTVGHPHGATRSALMAASKEVASAARVDAKRGLHYDMTKIGKTDAEKKFIGALERDGEFHSKLSDDFGRVRHEDTEMMRGARQALYRTGDILGSTVSLADRFTRIPLALSAYRLAERPGGFDKFAKAWGADENWKAAVRKYGPTPEAAGRFILSEGAFDYGRRNAPAYARGFYGRLMSQFHNFQIRALAKQLQLLTRMGPEGRRALAQMMVAVWALAGTQGLPFVQDAENGADELWKFLGHKDPQIAAHIRHLLEKHSGLGQTGADMILRGPISTLLGADLTSRLGFGDPITRAVSNFEVLGASPSILGNAILHPIQRYASHQGVVAAAAQAAPTFIRNAVQGTQVWPEQGVRAVKSGRVSVPASKITPADEVLKAMGWTPLDVTRAYERADERYRNTHR